MTKESENFLEILQKLDIDDNIKVIVCLALGRYEKSITLDD